MRSIKVGAGVVILREGKTLLAKRKGSHGAGSWGSLGGHVEFGETPVDAVKREAREELGIEIDNIRFVSCTNLLKEGKHYLDVSFVADLVSGEPRICEPDRIEALEWFAVEELPEPLFEPVRIALDALKSGQAYFEVME
jgi:8-oxo-dGTP diphosphatase